MSNTHCKADLLSIPPLLAKLLGKQYNEEDDLCLRISSRAYLMGDRTVGRTSPTRKVISISATPLFHKNPRFTTVMYRETPVGGDNVYHVFAQVRVLFSVPTSPSATTVEDDAPKYALVRRYDRLYPSLNPDPEADEFLSHVRGYVSLLRIKEPTAEEDAYVVGCMQLKFSGSHVDRIIPLSWIVQDVMIIPSFINPDIHYLNKWYWKE